MFLVSHKRRLRSSVLDAHPVRLMSITSYVCQTNSILDALHEKCIVFLNNTFCFLRHPLYVRMYDICVYMYV